MGKAVKKRYSPKPRHDGEMRVRSVAWFAGGRVDEEVKRALAAEYNYSVRCFPAEVARDRGSWGKYKSRLQRNSNGWRTGDRIFWPEDHERMKAGLAAGLNIRRIFDEMSGKRGDKPDARQHSGEGGCELTEGVLLPAV